MSKEIKFTLTLAFLVGTLMIVTMAIQPVLAPRTCLGGVEFKKLTHEFEKTVKNPLEEAPIIMPMLDGIYLLMFSCRLTS